MLRLVRHLSVTRAVNTNYGYVGLGQMGQHMARHIYNHLEKEDKLYVHDVSSEATDKFIKEVTELKPGNKEGLHKLDSLQDFVHKVDGQLDFVLTMVPEGRHVKGVVEELIKEYKSAIPPKPVTIVDSSTIDIPTSRAVHDYVKKEIPSFDFIDAPVSGGVAGARKGTLSFMLSRDNKEAIDPELYKLLTYMGKNIFPCGQQHGTGLAAKLSNNYLLAVTNLAVADSFQLAKSFGLNLDHYAKLVAVSTGKSWASVDNCPIPGVYPPENQLPADVDYQGGFITKLTRKDLVLATQCAKSNSRFLFMGDVSRYWYDKACEDEKLANKDLGVLYKWLGDIDESEGEKLLAASIQKK